MHPDRRQSRFRRAADDHDAGQRDNSDSERPANHESDAWGNTGSNAEWNAAHQPAEQAAASAANTAINIRSITTMLTIVAHTPTTPARTTIAAAPTGATGGIRRAVSLGSTLSRCQASLSPSVSIEPLLLFLDICS